MISYLCTFLPRWRHTKFLGTQVYTLYIWGKKMWLSCSNYAIQRTALDDTKKNPEAIKAVLENYYMDNYLDSVESREGSVESLDMLYLLRLGWFNFIKFVSSLPCLVDRIDGFTQSTESEVIVSSNEEQRHKLEFRRVHNNDTLFVSRSTHRNITNNLTQRMVLSLGSKIYQPIANCSCRNLYSQCSLNHERHLASQWVRTRWRVNCRHSREIPCMVRRSIAVG